MKLLSLKIKCGTSWIYKKDKILPGPNCWQCNFWLGDGGLCVHFSLHWQKMVARISSERNWFRRPFFCYSSNLFLLIIFISFLLLCFFFFVKDFLFIFLPFLLGIFFIFVVLSPSFCAAFAFLPWHRRATAPGNQKPLWRLEGRDGGWRLLNTPPPEFHFAPAHSSAICVEGFICGLIESALRRKFF